MGGVFRTQLGEQLGHLLLIGDGETAVGGVQLFQMLLSQIDQDGEYRGRGSRRSAEILVADGGVDAGVGSGLDGLQHGEQPPQEIGDIGGVRIERHL